MINTLIEDITADFQTETVIYTPSTCRPLSLEETILVEVNSWDRFMELEAEGNQETNLDLDELISTQ